MSTASVRYRRAVYIRERALGDVERVVEAISELTIGATAMVDRRDFTHEEERAFIELLEPMGDVLRSVKTSHPAFGQPPGALEP